jgi:hypothetical protein
VITNVATTGRQLISVMPDTERGNHARMGVRVPPELLIDHPYDPMSAEFLYPGTVVRHKPSVVQRKADFAGLWVIVSDRGGKYTLFKLGGSMIKIPGQSPAMFDVVPVGDLPEAVAKYATEVESEHADATR